MFFLSFLSPDRIDFIEMIILYNTKKKFNLFLLQLIYKKFAYMQEDMVFVPLELEAIRDRERESESGKQKSFPCFFWYIYTFIDVHTIITIHHEAASIAHWICLHCSEFGETFFSLLYFFVRCCCFVIPPLHSFFPILFISFCILYFAIIWTLVPILVAIKYHTRNNFWHPLLVNLKKIKIKSSIILQKLRSTKYNLFLVFIW